MPLASAASTTSPLDHAASVRRSDGVPRTPAIELGRSPNALSSLSIVLPCLDEEENIADAVRNALSAAERCATDYEVIVVDDGSTDGTSLIVASLMEQSSHVRLVLHSHNRGYGDALRTGIDAARMDWVLLTDADLQFDLRELEDFLPAAARSEMVLGWRILRQDPVHRRANAAAWNWLVRQVFHLPVRDVDCAFKLLRRDLVQSCGLVSSGAMISTELVVRCLATGARLEQLGVHHRARVAGESSGANPRVVARAFRELMTLRHRLAGPPAKLSVAA